MFRPSVGKIVKKLDRMVQDLDILFDEKVAESSLYRALADEADVEAQRARRIVARLEELIS